MTNASVRFCGLHDGHAVELVIRRSQDEHAEIGVSVSAVLYGPDGRGRGWVQCDAPQQPDSRQAVEQLIERLGTIAMRRALNLIESGRYRGPVVLRLSWKEND
jgi:hypothetical protein